MAKQGSLLQQIKDRIANAGKSRKSMFFVKDGQKRRVRFLTDFEEGVRVTFHDKYQEVNTPCLKQYGKSCEFCGVEGLRTRDQFAWSVYDYEAKEVRVLMYAPNAFSPVVQLVEYYETEGTLLDHDFVIARRGSGTDTSYAVMGQPNKKFKIAAKPFGKKKLMQLIWDANGPGSLEDFDELDEEDEEEAPRKKRKKPVDDDDDFEEDEEEEELDDDDEDDSDEEDEDSDDEDDDEEEELPRRRKPVAKKPAARRGRR